MFKFIDMLRLKCRTSIISRLLRNPQKPTRAD